MKTRRATILLASPDFGVRIAPPSYKLPLTSCLTLFEKVAARDGRESFSAFGQKIDPASDYATVLCSLIGYVVMTNTKRRNGTVLPQKVKTCLGISPYMQTHILNSYSSTRLSPFPTSSKCTSSKSSPSALDSARAALSASSSVQTFRRRNQDIIPPPFFTSSCVATQYFARSTRCAKTPFFAPRFSCCAAPIDTSCKPCRKASVWRGGSAKAMGANAV